MKVVAHSGGAPQWTLLRLLFRVKQDLLLKWAAEVVGSNPAYFPKTLLVVEDPNSG